jgi:multicomponent Na+:H+ antiporter subunit B
MLEQVLLILLVVLAVLAIRQKQMRTAVIYLAIYSLFCSAIYLLHAAPDVAIAEAVIGSTISTVLYLVALKRQDAVCLINEAPQNGGEEAIERKDRVRQLLAAVFLAGLGILFLYAYHNPEPEPVQETADLYRRRFLADTGAENAVTAIYLNYRIFDTLFETLTLQISVMGVIYFSRHKLATMSGTLTEDMSDRLILPAPVREPPITGRIAGLLVPLILLLGVAIVLNGHRTPGGGFQGGAILAAVLIMRYMVLPQNDMRIEVMQRIEKVMFILIVLVPLLFLFSLLNFTWPALNVPYLVLLNSLIAIKVCCGISIIFLRFTYYESR